MKKVKFLTEFNLKVKIIECQYCIKLMQFLLVRGNITI